MGVSSLGGLLVDVSDAAETTPALAGQFDGEHILAPLLTAAVPTVTDQLKVATTLTRITGASLSVIDPLTTSGRTPATYHQERDDDAALLEWALDQTRPVDPATDAQGGAGGFGYTRSLVAGVLRTVSAHDVDTLVLPSGSRSGRLRKGLVDRIAVQAACDVLVVNGQAGYETVASVLLPVAGGPHSGLAADFARAVAADCDAWVDVLHVVDEDAPERRRERADEIVDGVSRRIDRPETTTTWVLDAEDTAEAIVDQSRCYDLTVIGAPTTGRLQRFIYGSTNRSVRSNARSVVLSARNNSGNSLDTG